MLKKDILSVILNIFFLCNFTSICPLPNLKVAMLSTTLLIKLYNYIVVRKENVNLILFLILKKSSLSRIVKY